MAWSRLSDYFPAMNVPVRTDLPIEPLIPEIQAALAAAPNLVLEAPPGAGKTTRVPLALLDAAWAAGDKIIVLEPRRLAARGAAARMAAMLGEEVGETVGYRVRLDRKVGPKTRIEAVTTGLFLRQLQGDPSLPGVAAILFDEFHERSIESDMALALSRWRRRRHCAGSAVTGDVGDARCRKRGGALARRPAPAQRRARLPGRDHPSGRRCAMRGWRDRMASRHPPRARANRRATSWPSCPARRRSAARRSASRAPDRRPAALRRPAAERTGRAIRRDPQGRRKIILATSIAETQLTIDGHARGGGQRPHAQPALRSGAAACRDSHHQGLARGGRATRAAAPGRTAPGICYRLWSAASSARCRHSMRRRSSPPIWRRWRWSWRPGASIDPDR